jgi:GNAT superfamily N-acetyltransferase
MDKEIIYRHARPGEEQRIIDLALAAFDDSVAPEYTDEGIAEFRRYCNLESYIERNRADHFSLVAEFNKEIIGMIEVRDHDHIALLFVDTRFQGHGIGNNLVNKAWEICRRNRPDVGSMTVHSSPNAVAAYEKMGFRPEDNEQCENGIRFVPMVRWDTPSSPSAC